MPDVMYKAYPILLELHRLLAAGDLSQEFFNIDDVQALVLEIEENLGVTD